eukprot:Rmarinus@m.18573
MPRLEGSPSNDAGDVLSKPTSPKSSFEPRLHVSTSPRMPHSSPASLVSTAGDSHDSLRHDRGPRLHSPLRSKFLSGAFDVTSLPQSPRSPGNPSPKSKPSNKASLILGDEVGGSGTDEAKDKVPLCSKRTIPTHNGRNSNASMDAETTPSIEGVGFEGVGCATGDEVSCAIRGDDCVTGEGGCAPGGDGSIGGGVIGDITCLSEGEGCSSGSRHHLDPINDDANSAAADNLSNGGGSVLDDDEMDSPATTKTGQSTLPVPEDPTFKRKRLMNCRKEDEYYLASSTGSSTAYPTSGTNFATGSGVHHVSSEIGYSTSFANYPSTKQPATCGSALPTTAPMPETDAQNSNLPASTGSLLKGPGNSLLPPTSVLPSSTSTDSGTSATTPSCSPMCTPVETDPATVASSELYAEHVRVSNVAVSDSVKSGVSCRLGGYKVIRTSATPTRLWTFFRSFFRRQWSRFRDVVEGEDMTIPMFFFHVALMISAVWVMTAAEYLYNELAIASTTEDLMTHACERVTQQVDEVLATAVNINGFNARTLSRHELRIPTLSDSIPSNENDYLFFSSVEVSEEYVQYVYLATEGGYYLGAARRNGNHDIVVISKEVSGCRRREYNVTEDGFRVWDSVPYHRINSTLSKEECQRLSPVASDCSDDVSPESLYSWEYDSVTNSYVCRLYEIYDHRNMQWFKDAVDGELDVPVWSRVYADVATNEVILTATQTVEYDHGDYTERIVLAVDVSVNVLSDVLHQSNIMGSLNTGGENFIFEYQPDTPSRQWLLWGTTDLDLHNEMRYGNIVNVYNATAEDPHGIIEQISVPDVVSRTLVSLKRNLLEGTSEGVSIAHSGAERYVATKEEIRVTDDVVICATGSDPLNTRAEGIVVIAAKREIFFDTSFTISVLVSVFLVVLLTLRLYFPRWSMHLHSKESRQAGGGLVRLEWLRSLLTYVSLLKFGTFLAFAHCFRAQKSPKVGTAGSRVHDQPPSVAGGRRSLAQVPCQTNQGHSQNLRLDSDRSATSSGPQFQTVLSDETTQNLNTNTDARGKVAPERRDRSSWAWGLGGVFA